MQIIERFSIRSLYNHERFLEICIGDVTDSSSPVDILCVSAFPNDYAPLPRTVIGALDAKGISVAQLALDKALDMRSTWHCWVSKEQDREIRRILCFEHRAMVGASGPRQIGDQVGGVFRTIREIVLAKEDSNGMNGEGVLDCVRIPLLATGDQGEDRLNMLDAIIRQAYLSLAGEVPVRRVQFVLRPDAPMLNNLLVRIGQAFEKVRAEAAQLHTPVEHVFDYFISYRHDARDSVDPVVAALRTARKDLRLFIDREQLTLGNFWKADLMNGLRRSAQVLCFITDTYPESPECMDEFHASVCMNREHKHRRFLLPLDLLTTRDFATLPGSIRNVQCLKQESDEDQLPETIANRILKSAGAALS